MGYIMEYMTVKDIRSSEKDEDSNHTVRLHRTARIPPSTFLPICILLLKYLEGQQIGSMQLLLNYTIYIFRRRASGDSKC